MAVNNLNTYGQKATALADTDKLLMFNNTDTYGEYLPTLKTYFTGVKTTYTIGTGGDYANVGAAVAQGKSGVFVLLSNVTETANTSNTSTAKPFIILNVSGGNYTWDLSTFTFIYRANKFINVNINNANFTDNNVLSKTFIKDINVTFTTGFASTQYYVDYEKCNITLLDSGLTVSNCYFYSNKITGGGTSSKFMTGPSKFYFNEFTGTFSYIMDNATNGFAFNFGNATGAVSVTYNSGGIIASNDLPNARCVCSGISGPYFLKIESSIFKTLEFANGSVRGDIINTTITDAVTTGAFTKIHYTNCTFINNITVASDDNSFTSCKIGVPGGGVKKLTINAGINDTIVRDLRTEAASIDNGTGTVLNEKIW